MLFKMVSVMTGRKLHRTDSKFLQLIIHNLNLLTKLLCFSVSAFAVSPFYKNAGGVSLLMGSRNETLKAPVILRYLKPENS